MLIFIIFFFFLSKENSNTENTIYCLELGGKKCGNGNFSVLNSIQELNQIIENSTDIDLYLANTNDTRVNFDCNMLNDKRISIKAFHEDSSDDINNKKSTEDRGFISITTSNDGEIQALVLDSMNVEVIFPDSIIDTNEKQGKQQVDLDNSFFDLLSDLDLSFNKIEEKQSLNSIINEYNESELYNSNHNMNKENLLQQVQEFEESISDVNHTFNLHQLTMSNVLFINEEKINISTYYLTSDTLSLSFTNTNAISFKIHCNQSEFSSFSINPSTIVQIYTILYDVNLVYRENMVYCYVDYSYFTFPVSMMLTIKYNAIGPIKLTVLNIDTHVNGTYSGTLFTLKQNATFSLLNSFPENMNWRIFFEDSTLFAYTDMAPFSCYIHNSCYIKTSTYSLSLKSLYASNAILEIDSYISNDYIFELAVKHATFTELSTLIGKRQVRCKFDRVTFSDSIASEKFGENITFSGVSFLSVSGQPFVQTLSVDLYSTIEFVYSSAFNTFLTSSYFKMPFGYHITGEFRYNESVLPSEEKLIDIMYNGMNVFCAPSINCRNFDFVYTSPVSGLDSYNNLMSASCVSKGDEQCIQLKLKGLPSRVNLTLCYSSDFNKCFQYFWINTNNISSIKNLIREETKKITLIIKEDMREEDFIDLSTKYNNYSIFIETLYHSVDDAPYKINVKMPSSEIIPYLQINECHLKLVDTDELRIKHLVLKSDAQIDFGQTVFSITEKTQFTVFSFNKTIAINSKNVFIEIPTDTHVTFDDGFILFSQENVFIAIPERDILPNYYFKADFYANILFSRTDDATLLRPLRFNDSALYLTFDSTFSNTYTPIIEGTSIVLTIDSSSPTIPISIDRNTLIYCGSKNQTIIPQTLTMGFLTGDKRCHFSHIYFDGNAELEARDSTIDSLSFKDGINATVIISNYTSQTMSIPENTNIICPANFPTITKLYIECTVTNSCGSLSAANFPYDYTNLIINWTIPTKNSLQDNQSWGFPILKQIITNENDMSDNETVLPIVSFNPNQTIIGNRLYKPSFNGNGEYIYVYFKAESYNPNSHFYLIIIIVVVSVVFLILSAIAIIICRRRRRSNKTQSLLTNLLDSSTEPIM